MNEAMMQAMALQNSVDGYLEGSATDPIPVTNQEGYVEQVDPDALVAEGMAFAMRDMAKNGPTRPRHNLFGAKTMTKAQLEEQKMNEQQGYPSNIEEANKVKELEGKIDLILNALSGRSSPVSTPPPAAVGGTQAPPAESPTLIPAPSGTFVQPRASSTVSDESKQHVSTQPMQQQVTLSNGKTISVPAASNRAMGLGPVAESNQLPPGTYPDQEPDDDWSDEPIIQQVSAPEEPQPDASAQKTEKVQQLVQEVVQFMQNNDVHRYWRRHLGTHVHRHFGYSGWPPSLQQEFDTRFRGFLNDPQFITTLCRKVLEMEMGYALGARIVAGFIVNTAGYTAFALCGLDQ